jgi:hypothetical protein
MDGFHQQRRKSMTINYDFSRRMHGFDMTDPVVVGTTLGGEPIVAYTNDYNGNLLTHIRILYQGKGDVWCPSKGGVSFPTGETTSVLTKLVERFATNEPAPVERKSFEQKVMDRVNSPDVQASLDRAASRQITTRAAANAAASNKAFDKAMSGLKASVKGTNGNGKPEPTARQWQELLHLTCRLSPENLSCDGEISRTQVAKRHAAIMKEWRAIEQTIGRKITEDDVWAWDRRTSAASKASR